MGAHGSHTGSGSPSVVVSIHGEDDYAKIIYLDHSIVGDPQWRIEVRDGKVVVVITGSDPRRLQAFARRLQEMGLDASYME
mgnify:CR=1 FL=1